MKMRLKKACLYFHTIRYLKPLQIYARIQKKFIKPKFVPVQNIKTRVALRCWEQVIRKDPSLLGASTFCFLNVTHNLDEIGWDADDIPKLWRYNLHYFDDLNARDAESREIWHLELIEKWIAENPPARGTGWEPYTTSLRIVNWVKWLMRGNDPPPKMLQSLADQAGWLSKNLE